MDALYTEWIGRRHAACGLASRLASRTEMRRPARQDNPLNRSSAAHARCTGAAVDAELVLILSQQAGAADIIANRRTALGDGPSQNGRDRAAQLVCLPRGKFAAQNRGMQSRFEARFIGINVADARDDALIEQNRLQVALGFREGRAPISGIDVERLRPELLALEMRIDVVAAWKEGGAAEATDVAKPQFVGAVVQGKDEVGMIPARLRCRRDQELARHAQVNEQPR